MSSQGSPDPGRSIVVQKPKADVYTVLLGIALGAILIAIICLWIELARYKYDYRAAGASATSYLVPVTSGLADGQPAIPLHS
jgi:hypothetical protein